MTFKNYAGVPDVGPVEGLFDDSMPPGKLAEDGVPHSKCCGDCAMRDLSQQDCLVAACVVQGAAFYCVHRDPADLYRVCAGFAAFDAAGKVRLP